VADPRAGAFQPNPSLACPPRLVASRGLWQRVDGLLPCHRRSSIARAGETGETGRGVRRRAAMPRLDFASEWDGRCSRRSVGARPCVIAVARRPRRFTLASDPDHPSAFVPFPPDRHGSFARSRLLRVAFRYPFDLARPGRATQVFPRPPPDGAPGVRVPFAGLIPPTGGCATLRSLAVDRAAGSASVSADTGHSRSSSAFLPVRAHVSFVPPHPPRLIFVGVTDRLLES
jgi:hypothetical protein